MKRPTATEIVRRFLTKHDVRDIRCDPGNNSPFFPDTGLFFTAPWLTRWVWHEFHEAPTQASITNAYCVIRSLIEEAQA